jgi:ribosome-binding factor A
MSSKRPSQREILSSCDQIGPDDGVDPGTSFRAPLRRRTNRKALQMCGEIARTLSLVLSWESRDDLLRNLIVESVEPAPNSTRVLVTVSVQGDTAKVDLGEVLKRLQHSSGRLRTEVAAAIHRKRVPELTFRLLRLRQ